jgi:tetrahydrodipicolinate N-acetyltransferase
MGVTLTDTDVHKLRRHGHVQPHTAPLVIEDRCWIGAGAIVLKGVTMHSGAVAAAGSVVTRDVPARVLVAGIPASVMDSDIDWQP